MTPPENSLSGLRATVVGSRRIDEKNYLRLADIAFQLASRGAQIVTGTAAGADSAAVEGALRANQKPPEIWGPFNGHDTRTKKPILTCTDLHLQIVAACHPRAFLLDGTPKRLHARNIGQVLGPSCQQRSHVLICFTPDGCQSDLTRTTDTGGTGTAISLAYWAGVPICNIAASCPESFLERMLASWTPAFSSFAPNINPQCQAGLNISSNSKGFAGALTNPTALAKKKGTIQGSYAIDLGTRLGVWPDTESAYQHFKHKQPLSDPGVAFNNKLITWLQAVKLIQHPRLLATLDNHGGPAWLAQCSHFVGAPPVGDSLAEWTGQGLRSRFLRTMIAAYWMAHSHSALTPETTAHWENQLGDPQTSFF